MRSEIGAIDGTFAYIERITIDPSITGKDNAATTPSPTTYEEGRDTNNMALNYDFINYGAKADINDKVSVGVFFDQPWGADVEFKGNNNFVNNPQVNLAIATKAKENLDKISLTDPNYIVKTVI